MKMKKLIPALAMLLVSAILLGTSTYAWFSMNTKVDATSMEIVAKSNNTFLLIGTGANDTAAEIQAVTPVDPNAIEVALAPADAQVYPSSPALTAAEAGYLTTAGKTVSGAAITTAGVVVDNTAKAAAVTNWFTASAIAPSAAAIDTATARQLESYDGYVIRETVYLTVASGANNADTLSVTPTFTQKTGGSDLTAAKVLICTDDGGFAVLTSADSGSAVDIKGNDTAITDSTVRTVYIYIYYDGDETPVYTNNMANLAGAEIALAFNVEVA